MPHSLYATDTDLTAGQPAAPAGGIWLPGLGL